MKKPKKLSVKKIFYCPKCGRMKNPCRYVPVLSCGVCKVEMVPGEKYFQSKFHKKRFYPGQLIEINYCPRCGSTEIDPIFYAFCTDCKVNYKQGVCHYSSDERWRMKEIKQKYLLNDPLYDEEAYEKRYDHLEKYLEKIHEEAKEVEAEFAKRREEDSKCPKCGSKEIYVAPFHVWAKDYYMSDLKTKNSSYFNYSKPTICHNCGNKWGRGIPAAKSFKEH